MQNYAFCMLCFFEKKQIDIQKISALLKIAILWEAHAPLLKISILTDFQLRSLHTNSRHGNNRRPWRLMTVTERGILSLSELRFCTHYYISITIYSFIYDIYILKKEK
jgi:hypothetical protein